MHTPSFAEANAFLAVLEQKNFTKAAKQLGLSPPRVSEMVRNLEERLGVRLVERTTRSVAPTAAGERLFERLRPVLDDYQTALEATDEFRAKPAGRLRLTVAPPAADLVLAPAIARFLALYPEISLDVSIDSALADVVAQRFDAGIRVGDRLERDMIALRLTQDWPLVTVASPDYLKRHGAPKTPQELTEHACIRVRLPSGALLPWRMRFKRRVLEVQADGRLVVTDIALALRAAIEGAGLLQIRSAYVAGDIGAGRLVALLEPYAPPPREGFFLYYPSRRQIRPPLKALIDFLREARKA